MRLHLQRKQAVLAVSRFGLTIALTLTQSAAAFADSPTRRASAASSGADCSIADTAIETASSIRKLSVKKRVPCRLQNKVEVEKYLRATINKKVPEEHTRSEGQIYELLGIVPRHYDYLNKIIELYTDQLGGYYDPETAAYTMASWLPPAMQMSIAVHELTHALQDQHYHLDKLMDESADPSDTLMARSALVEGDATAVMLDYTRGLSGQGSISKEPSVSSFLMTNITGAMITSSVSGAPPAMQAMLIFPYVSGLNFVHQLLKKGGYSEVDRGFERLPQSTEEILHPEIYLAGKKSFRALPPPVLPEDFETSDSKPAFDDRLGEFTMTTLLGTYLPPLEASAAAAGWGGDRLVLYRGKQGGELLLWDTEWDTKKDADEFYGGLKRAYELRFEKPSISGDAEFEFSDLDIGSIRVAKRDKSVQIVVRGKL